MVSLNSGKSIHYAFKVNSDIIKALLHQISMKNKLLLALLITPIFLISCGGGSKTADLAPGVATQNANKSTYQSKDFNILFPKDWESIEKDSFTSNIPAETVVGFRNNIKNDVFTTNVNVAKTTLADKTTLSKDFAKSTLANAKKHLVNFNQISLTDYKFPNGDKGIDTFIADFEGRKTASESTIHFRELYVVNGSIGYTVTGAYLPTEDNSVVLMVDEMLKSLALK